jgi:hypothetical protein
MQRGGKSPKRQVASCRRELRGEDEVSYSIRTRLCIVVLYRSVRDPGRQVEDVGNLSRVVVDVEIGVTDKPMRR